MITTKKLQLVEDLKAKWDQDLLAEFESLKGQVLSIWDSVDVGSEMELNLEYMLGDVEDTMECYAAEIEKRGLR